MEVIIKEVLLGESKELHQGSYIIDCAIYMRSATQIIPKLVKQRKFKK